MLHSEIELLKKTMNLIKINLVYLYAECSAKIDDNLKLISAIHNISTKLIDLGYKNYIDAVSITIPIGFNGIQEWEKELDNKMKRFINDSIIEWV